MAGESMLMADPNKMAAHKPAASVLPGNVERPPKDFKGCKCPILKCVNSKCPCNKNRYPCTSKCKCQGCKNIHGTRGSDSNTGPGSWCRCTSSECLNKYCHCVKGSHGCTSKCKCENCRNPRGVRGSEPEQADDTNNMVREPPQMGSREASKRPRTE